MCQPDQSVTGFASWCTFAVLSLLAVMKYDLSGAHWMSATNCQFLDFLTTKHIETH